MLRLFLCMVLSEMAWACLPQDSQTHDETELNLIERKSYLSHIPKLWEPFVNVIASRYVSVGLVRHNIVNSSSYKEIAFMKHRDLHINNIQQFSLFFFLKKKYLLKWWSFVEVNFKAKGITFRYLL